MLKIQMHLSKTLCRFLASWGITMKVYFQETVVLFGEHSSKIGLVADCHDRLS